LVKAFFNLDKFSQKMEGNEFKSINDIAGTFSGIKIKKMKEFQYNKSDLSLYVKELKENGYLLLRW